MTPAVELRDIAVHFGPVVAVDGVSLTVAPGEAHALVGENGAGKSTLMRALFGLAPLARGEVWIHGQRLLRPTPEVALAAGVGMVHQHFMLVEPLTVAENVVLGREPIRKGLFDRDRARAEVRALGERYGLRVDPDRPIRDLSVGERQRVEILKVLYRGAQILVLDEPTAVLTPPEVSELFTLLAELRRSGATLLIVTHKLDEVMASTDRVTVLRRGRVTGELETRNTTREAIAHAMVGRDVGALPLPSSVPSDRESLLDLHGVSAGRLTDVSLTLRAGEILGIAGVEGNGQTELGEAIAGLCELASGTIRLAGSDITHATVAERRRRGLAHVPEDRHRRGLLLDLSIAENFLLGRTQHYRAKSWGGLGIDRQRLLDDTTRLLERFDVRPADPEVLVRSLSGGNQQKIVLGRELENDPRVLLAAQPTRGVDIGAIERIHAELDALRKRGGAVLLISAELDELLALCDRIAVLYRGRIVATLARSDASREALGPLMTGAGRVEVA